MRSVTVKSINGSFFKTPLFVYGKLPFSWLFFTPLKIVETVLKTVLIWFQRFQCGLPWFTPPLSRPIHRFGQIIF